MDRIDTVIVNSCYNEHAKTRQIYNVSLQSV